MQDFRDLQIWWNLAWFDPSFLAQEPLNALVEKGRDFSEADKQIVFEQVRRVLEQVIPEHKKLQDAGQIEVIVTPYAHPILPLLYATDLAKVGDPSATLPPRFSYPNDAITHVEKAVEVYEDHYGRAPRGMWPAEGAVAQEIVKFVSDAGFTWMASGEGVLAKSLGLDGFTRNTDDVVEQADALYRPYYVRYRDAPPVAVVFRDLRISDLIGFEYSGTPAEEAADDFVTRIEAIRTQLKAEDAEGPHLVSVILDGENAWEHYPNDGIDFLNALYTHLSESDTIVTVTPSEYLEMFPDQRELDSLWPGAWFSTDYGTWIGEPEENTAWEYLLQTRKVLAQYDMKKEKETTPEALAQALDFMYLAEGSDWFWWYGADQDSGNDAYFDQGYRALLRGVYESLGEPVPSFVEVPIIPAQAAPALQEPTGVISPAIDGAATADEWAAAGSYEARGGAQARGSDVIASLTYGYGAGNLYVRVDARQDWTALGDATVGLYVGAPGTSSPIGTSRFSDPDDPTLLGFNATHLAEATLEGGTLSDAAIFTAGGSLSKPSWLDPVSLEAAGGERVLEMAVPLAALGDLSAGDALRLSLVVSQSERDAQQLPAEGPIRLVLPDLSSVTWFLVVDDPAGDDYGPGAYTYPTDPVFENGVFDVKQFSVGVDQKNLVMKFELNGPIENVWGSGIGLSVQTFDVYIDTDPGAGTGARMLLEGRNAALEKGNGWDYAVWAEGWNQKVLRPDESGAPVEMGGENLKVIVDPTQQAATLRVPLALFGEGADPTTWGYAAAVLSQEGFPAPGVRRVRDVQPAAEQWRIGGGPDDTNHTRIMDLAWPTDALPDQAAILSTYPSSQDAVGSLSPDDFAQVPLLQTVE